MLSSNSCFPLNTVLQDPRLLIERTSQHTQKLAAPPMLDDKKLIDQLKVTDEKLFVESADIKGAIGNCTEENTTTGNGVRRSVRSRSAAKANCDNINAAEEGDSATESAMSTSGSESESELVS